MPSKTVRFLVQEVTKGTDPHQLPAWQVVSTRIGKLPEEVACVILRSIDAAGLLAESMNPYPLPSYRQGMNEVRKIQHWRKQNAVLDMILQLPVARSILESYPPLGHAPRHGFLRALHFYLTRYGRTPLTKFVPKDENGEDVWTLLEAICGCFTTAIAAESIRVEFHRFDQEAKKQPGGQIVARRPKT